MAPAKNPTTAVSINASTVLHCIRITLQSEQPFRICSPSYSTEAEEKGSRNLLVVEPDTRRKNNTE
jgi:hypothetical protein